MLTLLSMSIYLYPNETDNKKIKNKEFLHFRYAQIYICPLTTDKPHDLVNIPNN